MKEKQIFSSGQLHYLIRSARAYDKRCKLEHLPSVLEEFVFLLTQAHVEDFALIEHLKGQE